MENLINYIKPELLILPVILYFVGMILKKSKLKDNFIPLILMVIGIVLATTYVAILEGFTLSTIAVGLVQGYLCSAVSNNVHQVIKQMKKLGNDKADLIEDIVESLDNKS